MQLSDRRCPASEAVLRPFSVALRRVERVERAERPASAEADEVVKPVTHKLKRIAPVRGSALVRRRSHGSKKIR